MAPDALHASEKLPLRLVASDILTQVVGLHDLNLLYEVGLTQGITVVTLHRTLTCA